MPFGQQGGGLISVSGKGTAAWPEGNVNRLWWYIEETQWRQKIDSYPQALQAT